MARYIARLRAINAGKGRTVKIKPIRQLFELLGFSNVTSFAIIFLSERLDPKRRQKLRTLQTETDEFRVHGREIFWLRRQKKGGSSFTTVSFEKTLDSLFTIRSAKTVKKMAAKYPPTKA